MSFFSCLNWKQNVCSKKFDHKCNTLDAEVITITWGVMRSKSPVTKNSDYNYCYYYNDYNNFNNYNDYNDYNEYNNNTDCNEYNE